MSPSKKKSAYLPVVGWQEKVIFPNWKNILMKAKVDTGARTSAIHSEEYKIVRLPSTPSRPVNEELRMKLKIGSGLKARMIEAAAPIVDYRSVKNSGGKIEERPFIETTIRIGGKNYPIILSVTNREKMKFPILLGRAFLSGKFLVDPAEAKALDILD